MDDFERHPRLPAVTECLQKFLLHETKGKLYLVGCNRARTRYRVLKIDRGDDVGLLAVEDPIEYNAREIRLMMNMVDSGNKATGGITKTVHSYGILGCIRFLEGYYIVLVTKRRKLGNIGGHFVYGIGETIMIPVRGRDEQMTKKSLQRGMKTTTHETRYKNLFAVVDVTKDFYFSYTYDLTRSLQCNMKGRDTNNETFTWNHYLASALDQCESVTKGMWQLRIIHGFFAHCKLSIYGRLISVTLIARRSRHFAGTRYLKRGVNSRGHVANDVETEQIVADDVSGTLVPGGFTSYVQMRGSIPLFWSQDTNVMIPKPPIQIQRIDPLYTATRHHFADLLRRYGGPLIVFNLIKQVEKRRRECVLGDEFRKGVTFVEQFLPPGMLEYIPWDFKTVSKTLKSGGLFEELMCHSRRMLARTSFFFSGGLVGGRRVSSCEQTGVVRANCIDCLDRTNVAQFCMGVCALGEQLYALGVTDSPVLDPDSPVETIVVEMYEVMGDYLSLQYGGSQAHKVNALYRSNAFRAAMRKSLDLVTSFRRHYSNIFTDEEKQDAINLFLGKFVPEEGKLPLWELESDYYLHFLDGEEPVYDTDQRRGSRAEWELALRELDLHQPFTSGSPHVESIMQGAYNSRRRPFSVPSISDVDLEEDREALYFNEFHKPIKLTQFDKLFDYASNVPIFLQIYSPNQSSNNEVAEGQRRTEKHIPERQGKLNVTPMRIKRWFTDQRHESKCGTLEVSQGSHPAGGLGLLYNQWPPSALDVYGVVLESNTTEEDLQKFRRFVGFFLGGARAILEDRGPFFATFMDRFLEHARRNPTKEEEDFFFLASQDHVLRLAARPVNSFPPDPYDDYATYASYVSQSIYGGPEFDLWSVYAHHARRMAPHPLPHLHGEALEPLAHAPALRAFPVLPRRTTSRAQILSPRPRATSHTPPLSPTHVLSTSSAPLLSLDHAAT